MTSHDTMQVWTYLKAASLEIDGGSIFRLESVLVFEVVARFEGRGVREVALTGAEYLLCKGRAAFCTLVNSGVAGDDFEAVKLAFHA